MNSTAQSLTHLALIALVPAAIAALAMSGCSQESSKSRRVYQVQMIPIGCAPTPERQAWVLKCIENANPKSDEEPEDWLGMCTRMSNGQFCKPVPAVFAKSGAYWQWSACSTLPLNHKARASCDLVTWPSEPRPATQLETK